MSFLTGPMHHHLEGHKDLTAHKDVLILEEPDDLYIPLVNGRASCTPLVQPGDEVKVGTKLGEPVDHWYVPVFSPVSGTVVGVEKRMSASLKPTDHLHIKNDHTGTTVRAFEPFDYESATREEVLEFTKKAGMLGLGGAGFPTFMKYSKPENIDLFIINAVECEPYLTADYRNSMENASLMKAGALALLKLSTAPKGAIAVKEDKHDLIDVLKTTFAGTPIEVKTVKDIYPAGWERTLVYMLTGRRYDRLPAEAGCILNNVSTCIALGDAMINGRPITHKYVTVSGDGVKDPHNVYCPVGTPSATLIKACGGYTAEDCLLIAGGPMMGFTQTDLNFPMMKGSNGIVALNTDPAQAVECIKCGRCVDVCPMELKPLRYAKYAKLENWQGFKDERVMDCMECRCCQYICPSKIDLIGYIRSGKAKVREMK